MTDKTGPLSNENEPEMVKNDPEDNVGDTSEEHHQMMFDKTFSKLMDGFGKACEEEGVRIAVALVDHPKYDRPMVFYRAPHIVDAAALMAAILREVKTDVFTSLDTEPQ